MALECLRKKIPPICGHCGQPLDSVELKADCGTTYTFDEDTGKYDMSSDPDQETGTFYCGNCDNPIDSDTVYEMVDF